MKKIIIFSVLLVLVCSCHIKQVVVIKPSTGNQSIHIDSTGTIEYNKWETRKDTTTTTKRE